MLSQQTECSATVANYLEVVVSRPIYWDMEQCQSVFAYSHNIVLNDLETVNTLFSTEVVLSYKVMLIGFYV